MSIQLNIQALRETHMTMHTHNHTHSHPHTHTTTRPREYHILTHSLPYYQIEHEGNEDIFLQFGFIGESYKMEAIYQGNDNVASDDIISMLGMTKEVVINTYTTKMTVTIATLGY